MIFTRRTQTERAKRATGSLYGSYFRTLYLSRLAWVAFWACFVYFLLWSIPLFGIGLTTEDYTPQLAVTMSFAAFCMLLGMISGTLRSMARRKREALVAWASLYDEAMGTHTRSHLYDRLSLECERSERHGSLFALLVLRVRPVRTDAGHKGVRRGNGLMHHLAAEVRSAIRNSDLVAVVSNDEFGILLCGVDLDAATLLARRLRDSLETSVKNEAREEVVVNVGLAMYGDETRTPEALVEAARASMSAGLGSAPCDEAA